MPADTSCNGFCGMYYEGDTSEALPEDPGVFEYEGGGWILDDGTAHPYQSTGVVDDGFSWKSVSSLLELVANGEPWKGHCFPRKWGGDQTAPSATWNDIIPLLRPGTTVMDTCKCSSGLDCRWAYEGSCALSYRKRESVCT